MSGLEGGMMMSSCSCEICHGNCDDFKIKSESGDEDGWLAGADGCPTLNKYLRGYFIATKLLKQQFVQVAPNFSQTKQESESEPVKRKVGKGRPKKKQKWAIVSDLGFGSNESVYWTTDKLLYSVICGRCDKIVNEAVYLHQQKMKLQQRIDRLGETLQEMRILADKEAREAEERAELEKRTAQEEGSIKATQNQMLGLSLACLGKGKVSLPPPRRTPKKLCTRRQSRKSYLEVERLELEPEPQNDETDCNFPNDLFYDLDNEQQDDHQYTDLAPEMNDEDLTIEALTAENYQGQDVDLDYEPSEEDASNCSNDDSDSDFEPSPKKKSRSSTSKKTKEYSNSSSDDDNANYDYDEDEHDNDHRFQIIGNDIKPTKLPLHKTEYPELPNSTPKSDLPTATKRNQVQDYQCEICLKKLFNNTSLHTHLARIHNKKLQYNCPNCDQFFAQKGQLIFHRIQDHKMKQKLCRRRLPQTEEEKKWSKIPCGQCGKVCLSAGLLDTHLRKSHELQIPQEERLAVRKRCHFCNKRFYLEQRYSIHVKMVHPEKAEEAFRCNPCNVGYTTTALLKQHFKQSHDAVVEGDFQTIHVCKHCDWPFLDESCLKSHIRVHKQPKTVKKPEKPRNEIFAAFPFKCYFCWEAFPQRDKLERHMKNNTRHKTLVVEFPCDVESCYHYNKPFNKLEELNKHLRDSHGNSGEILECQWCSWGFTSENMFTLHKLNHQSPSETYHYKCPFPLCDRICKKKITLINHYNVAHELNLKPNKCPHCPERFVTLLAVSVHVKEEHSDLLDISKMLTCHQCGKICSSGKNLGSHVRSYHHDHTCSTCSKVFKTYDLMRKHVKKEHSTRTTHHLCSLCGVVKLSSYALRSHMNEVHKKPKFECQICHAKLKCKANLKYHMKSMHDPTKFQGPPAPFVCKECGKGYTKKDSLDDHVRVNHSQDSWRVHTCHQCGKRFQREIRLIDHLKGKACPNRSDAPVIID